jgi:hypothetical protein
MSPAAAVENRQSKTGNRKSANPLGRLFGLFARLCEKRGIEGSREERLAFANSKLENRKSQIASWSELRPGEIGRLIHAIQVELDGVGASSAGPVGAGGFAPTGAGSAGPAEAGGFAPTGAGSASPTEAERRSALRLRYVLWLAPQVYGAEWDSLLHRRLERAPYHFYAPVTELDGRRMHGLIEELLDTLARENQKAEIRNRNEPLSSAELRAGKETLRREMVKSVRGKG